MAVYNANATTTNGALLPTPTSGQSPTVPAVVPTTAPSVKTPVVSTTTATDFLNNKAKTTLTEADKALQQKIDDTKAQLAAKQEEYKKSVEADKAASADKSPEIKQTPEEIIANTPDSDKKFAYQKDGTRLQIPITAKASDYGMLETKPPTEEKAPATVSNSVEVGSIRYDQMSDGTYKRFNKDTGVEMSGTAQDFKDAQTARAGQDKLQSIIDGTYPLDPDQEAQVAGLKTQWESVIKDERERSANLSGAEAVMQNLYGMGASKIGKDAIKDVIDKGADRVAELNSKMSAAVAAMRNGFKTDNFNMVKSAYDSFTTSQKERQAQFDTMTSETNKAIAAQKAYDENRNMAVENDIRGVIESASKTGGLTDDKLAAMNTALANKDFNAAVVAAGDSLTNVGGWMGDWYSYKNAMEKQYPGVKVMTPQEFKNWDDNNKAAIAKAGAYTGVGGSSLPAGTEIPFQATIDSALTNVSNASRGPLKTELYSLAQNGDYVSLLNRIEQSAKSQLTAQNRSTLEQEQSALPYLTQLNTKLKQYKDLGGDTGLIAGTESEVATKFGQLATDPKFASIAVELKVLFQKYRLSMTGAAFSEKESAEYGSVLPSAGKNMNLNFALLQGLKDSKEVGVDNAYSSVLPTSSYMNLKSKADAQLEAGGSPVNSSGNIILSGLDKATNAIQTFVNDPKNVPLYQTAAQKYPEADPETLAAFLKIKY